MSLKFPTIPSKTLRNSITAAATSFQLNDIKGWDGETDLVAGDFGTEHYIIFRNATKTIIELMEIDPATIADTSITIVRRGLEFDGDLLTEVSANKQSWVKGDTFVDLGTATPQTLQWLKEYIDGIAVAGAPDSSTATKGLVKMSTAPASPSEPIAVGTNDTRVPTQDENDALAGGGDFGTPSTSNRFVTDDYLDTVANVVRSPIPIALGGFGTTSPFFYQEINESLPASADQGGATSSSDGLTFFVLDDSGQSLKRYSKNTNTGIFELTHAINPTINIDQYVGLIIIDSYLYLFADNNTNIICSRFLATNLTGETVMTVPTVTSSNTGVRAWTDGTYAYVMTLSSSTTSRKWSVSGTTFTAVSTATVSSSLMDDDSCSFYDGTNTYVLKGTSTADNIVIYKLTSADGSSFSTTTLSYPYKNNDRGCFGISIGTNTMYVGRVATVYSSAGAAYSQYIYLKPVTKP